MSLYAEYIKGRENKEIIEDSLGFATYQITGNECYIVDIYVRPEARMLGRGSILANKITETG